MLLFSLHLASCLALAPVPEQPLSPPLKEIQGEWRAVSVEEKGQVWAKEEVAEFVLEVKGDVLIYKRNLNHVERFRITLNASKKPAQMDLRLIAEGVDPNKLCPVIYSVENGKLKLCLPSEFTAQNPSDRPAKFETGGERPPRGKLLVVMERIQKKKSR